METSHPHPTRPRHASHIKRSFSGTHRVRIKGRESLIRQNAANCTFNEKTIKLLRPLNRRRLPKNTPQGHRNDIRNNHNAHDEPPFPLIVHSQCQLSIPAAANRQSDSTPPGSPPHPPTSPAPLPPCSENVVIISETTKTLTTASFPLIVNSQLSIIHCNLRAERTRKAPVRPGAPMCAESVPKCADVCRKCAEVCRSAPKCAEVCRTVPRPPPFPLGYRGFSPNRHTPAPKCVPTCAAPQATRLFCPTRPFPAIIDDF